MLDEKLCNLLLDKNSCNMMLYGNKRFFILMWCYSYYVSKCVKTDVTCCMCEIGRCIWVVCAKMGCCSSGLKSVLKIGDEIWLKNG
jgi:hypothetical protein